MGAAEDTLDTPVRADFSLTIDGRAEESGDWIDVLNPATERVFARCPDASKAQLDAAVAAAGRAQRDWASLGWAGRRQLLGQLGEKLFAEREAMAQLLTQEQGKPIAQARGEVERAAQSFKTFASLEVEDQVLAEDEQRRVVLRYRPLGVVGAITPWNFPVALGSSKIISALITGNTLVLKPSPYTPLTTLRLGELSRGILPDGVLNVVSGGDQLGAWITSHPGIAKVSFTGSGPTGKKIMAASAEHLKRITLELGGNDPAIVLPDVDPKAVAQKVFDSAFANAGQVCVAVKRLYVHEDVYDEVCDELAAHAKSAQMGDGLDPATTMGPVQNRMQFERVKELIDDTKSGSGEIIAGGDVPDQPGYFIPATVVRDIEDGTRLVDEEPFGPVLPVIKFSDVEDAIRRANETSFGLGGSVWTNDLELGNQLAGELEVGTAWVNQHAVVDNAVAPFGGAKESGIGREYSRFGLISYMEPQVINISKVSLGA